MPPPNGSPTSASVGSLDDLAIGEMKMARVGGRRIVVARTESGTFALDNACPHQGYGLATGTLEGDLITCQWHNWKFCVVDGTCEIGEENVRSHPVEIRGNDIRVEVTGPTDAEKLEQLWPSLGRGIEADYRGQIARDTARLLEAGAAPVDIVWEGLRIGSPKADYGVGHEMAAAADCLAAVDLYRDLDRTLPITQALAGISESTRNRWAYQPPAPDATIDFVKAVEDENRDGAVAALRAALADGLDPEVVRDWFIETVAAHHLSYGHGAIYVQKAFELLDRAGWHRADDLLPHLANRIVHGTREDTLPYMAKAIREIDAADLPALAGAPDRRITGWAGEPELRRTLLDASEAPIARAIDAVLEGAGIGGLLDAVSLAVSERLIRYDHTVEHDTTTDFGWLDISHGLTYARAARWAWDRRPGPSTARLALFTVFLCFDTGRLERRTSVRVPTESGTVDGDLTAAVIDGRVGDAMANAAAGEIETVGDELRRIALMDGAGSFIVAAHLVKMAQAAKEEALVTKSNLPLVATARLAAAPRLERFVARNVAEAIGFVKTGSPPTR
jgi:nitrite reductase/ring-hydroxylating ferredoxin subunit